jgi:uncharacterized membrane protein YdcZ (DUF606 family)
MREPQFLPERYEIRTFNLLAVARTYLARMGNALQSAASRAMARPAKSALLTLAIALLVGTVVRVALVRHSGPNQAAAADHAASQPSNAHPTR